MSTDIVAAILNIRTVKSSFKRSISPPDTTIAICIMAYRVDLFSRDPWYILINFVLECRCPFIKENESVFTLAEKL